MSKVILVTGVTGQQGGAVVDALLSSPTATSDFTVLGVTRDANSASAQKLAAKSTAIKLITGNLSDCPALFKSASEITSQPIWGVYSIQTFAGKGQTVVTEVQQGKALIDESIKHGVKHFVYSSVERGGDEKSWNTPTNIPHFASKYQIELHLRNATATAAAAKNGDRMGWTILRPVAFMDNFQPGFGTKVFFTALRDTLGDKPLQLIACSDIGRFAAKAFREPDEYNHKALGLAGDELNFVGLSSAFQKKTGSPAGTTWSFVGSALLYGVKELGVMLRWFKTDGFGVDVKELRKANPGLMDVEMWLERESAFPKSGSVPVVERN